MYILQVLVHISYVLLSLYYVHITGVGLYQLCAIKLPYTMYILQVLVYINYVLLSLYYVHITGVGSYQLCAIKLPYTMYILQVLVHINYVLLSFPILCTYYKCWFISAMCY